jgi:hypothetical protein
MVELGKVVFLGHIHVIIWALDTQEGAWAKKVGLTSLKKLDWTCIYEPLAKELFCSFKYDDQYVKLWGQQINISEEAIAKVSKLPCEGLIARTQEGYNGVATTYFASM